MISLSSLRLATRRQQQTFILRTLQVSAVSVAGFLVLSYVRNGIVGAVFVLSFAGLATLAQRWARYCPKCEENITRQRPGIWCNACGSVAYPEWIQLGKNGVVELNDHTLSDDSQPVSRLTAMLLALAIRDKIQQVTIFQNGDTWFSTNVESYQSRMPMPDFLVPQVRSLLQLIASRGIDGAHLKTFALEIDIACTNEQWCGEPRREFGEVSLGSLLDNQQIQLSLFHKAA